MPFLNMDQMTESLNLVLLGKTGAGKSSTGNTILGREAFISERSANSVTRDVAVESGTVDGFPVTVYDTPGLFNTTLSEEETQQILEKVLQKCESRDCVFLLFINADSFTEEERKTVEKIEELLGENRMKKTWILFTRGDELDEEKKSIKEFIDETEPLKKLVRRYDQRYHVFNNKTKEPSEQAQELLTEIIKAYIDTKVNVEMKPNPLRRKIPDAVERKQREEEERQREAEGRKQQGKEQRQDEEKGKREEETEERIGAVFDRFPSEYWHYILMGAAAGVLIGTGVGAAVAYFKGFALLKGAAMGAGVGAYVGAGLGGTAAYYRKQSDFNFKKD